MSNPELSIPIPAATIEPKNIKQLRFFAFSLLNFLITSETTTNIVGKRIRIPAYPIINDVVLSNIKENIIKEIENAGAAFSKKLFSFLKKGNAI